MLKKAPLSPNAAGSVAASLPHPADLRSIGSVSRTDTASLPIPAPVTEVYSALIDPEALSSWLAPGDMIGMIERFDPRPGGSFRMVLKYPDHLASMGKTTSNTDVVEARFIDLKANERVVFAVDFVSDDPHYQGTMTMTWAVTAIVAGTLVEITADNVPDAVSAEDHAAGMKSSLEKLAEHFAK